MSWVFLAGDRVYKLRKPLRRAHLDVSRLSARIRHAEAEIRLNRRLAPDVYLGAASLRLSPEGRLSLDGPGREVERLVVMRRLPEDRTLEALARRGAIPAQGLAAAGARLAAFYRGLAPVPLAPGVYSARFAREQALTAQALRDPELGLAGPETEAALAGFERAFAAARPLLEARAAAGRIVEGHGDLRPEPVFLTDPPRIIDCLEFSRALREVDPFEEIAFLGMECARLGAGEVFPALRAALERGLEDRPPDALLAFHWRYRALLRARLAALHLEEPEPRTPERWVPLARAYLALAGRAEVRTARLSGR